MNAHYWTLTHLGIFLIPVINNTIWTCEDGTTIMWLHVESWPFVNFQLTTWHLHKIFWFGESL